MEVKEHAQHLDRVAFARPVSASEPSGPWLRREGLHAAVQEAMRSTPGDAAYGLAEKKPDWERVVELCGGALASQTKDLYLVACLLEGLAHVAGAAGIAQGLWALAELHERFWNDFHPRPRGGALDGRLNQLGVLERSFARILESVPMSPGLPELTWFHWKHAGEKFPGGEPNPFTAEDRERAVAEAEGGFYDAGASALREAEAELERLRMIFAARYAGAAPTFGEGAQALVELRQVFEEHSNATPADETHPHDPASEEEAPSEPAQVLEPRPPAKRRAGASAVPAAPVKAKGAQGRLLADLRALRAEDPGNPLSYVALRWTAFRELQNCDPAAPPADLPAPPSGERQRFVTLFEAGKWPELLERVELRLEEPQAAYWLDLQRYASAAMGQIGAPYGAPQREIHAFLSSALDPHRWLLEAKLADKTPAADGTTRGWLTNDVLKNKCSDAGVRAPAGFAIDLEQALGLLRQKGPEAALAALRDEARGAASGRERFEYARAMARILLEANRPELAVAVLEGAWQEAREQGLERWEGPVWLAAGLEELEEALGRLAKAAPSEKVRARLDELAALLTRTDPLRRLRARKPGG